METQPTNNSSFESCCICLEDYCADADANETTITTCGHKFHHECLRVHLTTARVHECPWCKTHIELEGVPPVAGNGIRLGQIIGQGQGWQPIGQGQPPWNWHRIAPNPNAVVDVDFIVADQDRPWNWHGIAPNFNANVVVDFIVADQDRPWNWHRIVNNV